MIVINMFGGPGVGKSTTSAGLYYYMKNEGYRVELVTEYAKDIVWAGRQKELDDQLYILAKQHHRLHTLKGKVDYAITDSPLILSSVYGHLVENLPGSFHDLVRDMFLCYTNRCVILHRTKPYASYGRNQTETEARDLDSTISTLLYQMISPEDIICTRGDINAPTAILEWIKRF